MSHGLPQYWSAARGVQADGQTLAHAACPSTDQHNDRFHERRTSRSHIFIPYAAYSGTSNLGHELVSLVRKHVFDETAHDAPRNSRVPSAWGVTQVDHQGRYIEHFREGLVKRLHEFLPAERVIDAHIAHLADDAIREDRGRFGIARNKLELSKVVTRLGQ